MRDQDDLHEPEHDHLLDHEFLYGDDVEHEADAKTKRRVTSMTLMKSGSSTRRGSMTATSDSAPVYGEAPRAAHGQ